jgi:hypothetical protein
MAASDMFLPGDGCWAVLAGALHETEAGERALAGMCRS